MVSQGSQGSPPGSLLLPLSKFSHATSSRLSEGQIPWIHLSSQDNLFIIFDVRITRDASGHAEERQYFRIIQDPNILEDIDMKILASEAQRAAQEFKTAQDLRSNPQVAVLVRKPCIAIKYPVDNGTFRRFQIRFTKEEDYYETMKILTRAGVPVLEAGGISKQQEQSSYRPMTTGPQHVSSIGLPQVQQRSAPISFGQASSTSFSGSTMVHSTTAPQPLLPASMPTPRHVHFTQPSTSVVQAQHQRISDYHSAPELSHRPIRSREVYSNAPSLSISSQPQHIVPSSINVYTPRPSTAPEVVTSTTKDIMPPRRELPFARKEKPVNNQGEKEQTTTLSQSREQATSTNILAVDEREVDHNLSQPTTKAMKAAGPKSRKRAAPRPKKAPAPKKSKTTVSHSKATTEVQTPIPSAAELMDHIEEVVPAIDTQILYAVAEAKVAASERITKVSPLSPEEICSNLVEPPEVNPTKQKRVTHSISQLAGATCPDVQEHVSTPQVPTQSQPCTPADQLIQNQTHTTASSPFTSHDQNNEDETPPQQSANPEPTPINQTTEPQYRLTNGKTKMTISATADTIPSVLSSPPFAQATSKLNDFAALPPNQQHDILEKFICQSLDDENFKTLCKTIEGVWSRALCLKP